MSVQYNGVPDNIVAPINVPILSSTQANPIVITTNGTHGLTNGDKVDVSLHQANTTANGVWTATVLSPTTFSIPANGIAIGGATGLVQSLALGATSAIPSDGDNENGASVDVPLETLLDRTAFLAAVTGKYKLVDVFHESLDGFAVANQWQVALSASGVWTAATTGGKVSTVSPVVVSDVLEINLACSPSLGSSHAAQVAIGAVGYAYGAAPGAPAKVAGSGQNVLGGLGGATYTSIQAGANLLGYYSAPATGSVDVWLFAQGTNGDTISFYPEHRLIVKIWRLTGQFQ